MFDNTQYPNVDLEALGLTRSGIVEETAAQAAAIASGQAPEQGSFEAQVAGAASVEGPVVLDYEDLPLSGSPAQAASHLRILEALARWAHAAAPGKQIGFYGLLERTQPRYVPLARRLARLEDAFFPSLYTTAGDRRQWKATLKADLALALEIAPQLPVYPYLWPQFRAPSGPQGGGFIGGALWTFELGTARRYVSGVVIWSKRVQCTSFDWVNATRRFMVKLRRAG